MAGRLRLREWRERRFLSQRDLGERAGITAATVNRIENGLHWPRPSTLRQLAEALQVDPDELIDWAAAPEVESKKLAA